MEGDYSQGCVFGRGWGCVAGGITVTGLDPASRQGDKVILDILQRCGAKIKPLENGWQFARSLLRATEIDLADCPDLGPILFTLGLLLQRRDRAAQRRAAAAERSPTASTPMQAELQKMGARILVDSDDVHILGTALHAPDAPLSGHNDHRVVMALAVAAAGRRAAGAAAGGPRPSTKSWPAFWQVLQGLGARVELD